MQAHTMAEAEGVWPVVERLAGQASARRVDLLVLPEATYPAYWLGSRAEFDAANLPDTETILKRFGEIARGGGFWLVVGLVERADGQLYNSAAVLDRSGRVTGMARKSFLWDCDNRWFTPARELSVFDTEFGRMGVLICADGRAPEITATLAARGAAFVVMPTAWVNAARGSGRIENPQAEYLIRARAQEFAVPFACANKSGSEGRAMEYVGQSQIVGAGGDVTAIAPIEGEHLVLGEVTPRRATPATLTEAQRTILGGEPQAIAMQKEIKIQIGEGVANDALAEQVKRAGGRCAVLAAGELRSFVAARCAALSGAQLLIVNGGDGDELFPRARAMENRVFIVVTDSAGMAMVVEPTGRVLWNRNRGDRVGGAGFTLNLGLADDKRVTRETDIWEQRRVASYAY